MESLIALHEIGNYTLGRMTDLLFGGGECFFLPNSTSSSCRADNIDVFAKAKELGWNVNTGLESFTAMKSTAQLPIMNLFANDHMSYEIDRDSKIQPSLREMVEKAIDILTYATKDSPHGFFLMIEGSRIDMAGHSNDAAAHVHDIIAYNDAIEYVKGYVDGRDDTVMVSVSDHETGGLSVAYQANKTAYPDYLWFILKVDVLF
jgi:alkaline phosphatase